MLQLLWNKCANLLPPLHYTMTDITLTRLQTPQFCSSRLCDASQHHVDSCHVTSPRTARWVTWTSQRTSGRRRFRMSSLPRPVGVYSQSLPQAPTSTFFNSIGALTLLSCSLWSAKSCSSTIRAFFFKVDCDIKARSPYLTEHRCSVIESNLSKSQITCTVHARAQARERLSSSRWIATTTPTPLSAASRLRGLFPNSHLNNPIKYYNSYCSVRMAKQKTMMKWQNNVCNNTFQFIA